MFDVVVHCVFICCLNVKELCMRFSASFFTVGICVRYWSKCIFVQFAYVFVCFSKVLDLTLNSPFWPL